jgi:short-chain Z-isoprenyl diphosphate synthase
LREPGAGHRRGADKLDELLGWCVGLGIGELTVWALSSENLERSEEEVGALLTIVSEKLSSLAQATSPGSPAIRIRVFGRLEALPASVAETVRRVEVETAANQGLSLNVALGYSGRDELVDATRALIASLAAAGVAAGEMAAHVDEAALARHLYTAEHSDPDLIIRTSGEMRLSGFLPGRAATASSTSPTSTGRRSASSISCAPCGRSSNASDASVVDEPWPRDGNSDLKRSARMPSGWRAGMVISPPRA